MLKRIATGDVELGMFIHKLEGNWFSHPFWKSRFLLDDEDLLGRLHDSSVPAVIIDTARGQAEPAGESPPTARPAAPVLQRGARRAAAASSRARHGGADDAELRSLAPRSQAREFGLANRIAVKSQQTISRVFLEARLGKAIEPAMVQPVVEDIFASIQRNPYAFNGLMRCKQNTEFVYRHALAVCALMIALGRVMKLAPEDIRTAGTIGLLIDLGVGHLPLEGEPPADFRDIAPDIFRGHVKIGTNILTAGDCPEDVALACLQHHERLDGSGYPAGLVGDEIGEFGRMAAICDTYDWLVDDTGGRPALDPAAATRQMAESEAGLDPELLDHFTRAIGMHPIGSIVELASGRLAMVVGQDPDDPMRPRVRVFWSQRDQRPLPPSDIALARCQGEDRIVGSADPAALMAGQTPAALAPLRERLFAAACAED